LSKSIKAFDVFENGIVNYIAIENIQERMMQWTEFLLSETFAH